MLVDFTPKQYVTFEKLTGDVVTVGPSYDDALDYIEVEYKQVEPILSLKESKDVYKVVYDTKIKNYKLVNRKEETVVYDSIQKFTDYDDDYDIKAQIKYKKSSVKFTLNEELMKALSDKALLNEEFTFSITKKDNPHYLLDIIKVNFSKNQPYKFTFFPNEFSIYTKGSFSKYVIEEIR